MGLSLALQNKQWMYLNGVILVSPADYKTLRVGGPVSSALNLPYFTAASWYHNKLNEDLQKLDLLDVLPISEDYAINKLIPAVAKGGFLSLSEKEKIAKKMSYFSGISEKAILQHNLIYLLVFLEGTFKRRGFTIGRLDSRYKGIDRKESGDNPDYNSELDSWEHSFTPAINQYILNELKFKTDIKYNMFGPVHPWEDDNLNTREDLRQAMAQNPYLNILTHSGYYDLETTYFASKYTQLQIDPSGRLRDRMHFKGYRSGHMMYLRKEDLKKANDDLREFILKTLPGKKPAKY